MNILFLSHYFPPEVNAPASRTQEHCVRWVRAGQRVTVITCAPNCPTGKVYDGYRNTFPWRTEDIDGIRVVRVWTLLAPNSGTVRRILNYLSYLVFAVLAAVWQPRPDVVVATSPQFFCGWAGVLVSWIKWRPFVLEIRDIWPESISAVGAMKKGVAIRLLEWLERRMYLAAEHIITVGNGYRDNILSKVEMPNRVSVITNGVDGEIFHPRPCNEEFLARYGLSGKFVCSYIGTIGMAHGLEVVIQAARLLQERGRDDIRFCLVGEGARRAELEALAREQKVPVVFTGRLSKETMPMVLASSDACLIHLRDCDLFETVIPSKIFETMAMGRPIVMGVRGESREIVRQAGAAVEMVPDSAESLLECVTALRDDLSFAHQLGESGRAFVAERYHRDTLAQQMLTILESVADNVAIHAAPAPSAKTRPCYALAPLASEEQDGGS